MQDSKKSQVTSEQMSTLLQANHLSYTVPPSISLFNSRQYTKYPAQNASYSANQTIICHLSNSDTFVNPKTSFLKFSVKRTDPNADTKTGFGEWGSATNLFSRVRYIHSSGVELSHNIDISPYEAMNTRVTESEEYWGTEAKLGGYNTEVTTVSKTYCIRLDRLCKMFRSEKLVPPFLLSGSRLELQTSTSEQAFVHASNQVIQPTTYAIEQVELVLDSYILSDASFSTIEMLSAEGKVEYTCEDYELITSTKNTNQGALELQKSLGRATRVLMGCFDAETLSDRETSYHQPLGADESFKNYQFRINSLYMPSLPADRTESYISALQAKHGNQYPAKLTYDDYFDVHVNDTPVGVTVVQNLQRNDWLGKSSGLPINSSSSLRANVEFEAGQVNTRIIKMYTDHVKILVPFLYDRVVVSV